MLFFFFLFLCTFLLNVISSAFTFVQIRKDNKNKMNKKHSQLKNHHKNLQIVYQTSLELLVYNSLWLFCKQKQKLLLTRTGLVIMPKPRSRLTDKPLITQERGYLGTGTLKSTRPSGLHKYYPKLTRLQWSLHKLSQNYNQNQSISVIGHWPKAS